MDSLCAVRDAEIFDMRRLLLADTCSHCVFVASSWFRDRCRGPLSRVPSYLPGYLLFEAVRTGLLLVRWPQYWPLIGWSNCMLFMFWRSHNAVWQGTGLYLFLFLLRHTRLGWATCLLIYLGAPSSRRQVCREHSVMWDDAMMFKGYFLGEQTKYILIKKIIL